MRIVSLLPAATEICFALGLGDQVVGVSPECDYPPDARGKAVASRVLLDYEGKGSGETSRLVGERLAKSEALYEIDESVLGELRPDLILTQGLCEVCAPAFGDVREAASRLRNRPQVLSLDPHTLEDIFEDIGRVARACRVEAEARIFIRSLRDRVEAVRSSASRTPSRPRVLCLEWLDPLFIAGHWVPELVSLAGGTDAFGRRGEKSRRIEPRDIAMEAPDVVVLMPCGFHMPRVLQEAPTVMSLPFWQDLPAARRDRVWLVDGSSYFNRPGPRVVDGLEILAHIFHANVFPKKWPRDSVQRWTG